MFFCVCACVLATLAQSKFPEAWYVKSLVPLRGKCSFLLIKSYLGSSRWRQNLTSQQVGAGTSSWHCHMHFLFMRSFADQASSYSKSCAFGIVKA